MKRVLRYISWGLVLCLTSQGVAQKIKRNPFFLPHEVDAQESTFFSVCGIISLQGKKAALLKHGNETQVVFVGSIVGAYVVDKILDDRVTLCSNKEVLVLQMM